MQILVQDERGIDGTLVLEFTDERNHHHAIIVTSNTSIGVALDLLKHTKEKYDARRDD